MYITKTMRLLFLIVQDPKRDENNPNKKKMLWFHFQKLMNILNLNEDTTKQQKRPQNVENDSNNSKKLKVEHLPGLSRFPDEMWLKILTYLSAKDIFGSFAYVSKHFSNLTIGSSSFFNQVGSLKGQNKDMWCQLCQS